MVQDRGGDPCPGTFAEPKRDLGGACLRRLSVAEDRVGDEVVGSRITPPAGVHAPTWHFARGQVRLRLRAAKGITQSWTALNSAIGLAPAWRMFRMVLGQEGPSVKG